MQGCGGGGGEVIQGSVIGLPLYGEDIDDAYFVNTRAAPQSALYPYTIYRTLVLCIHNMYICICTYILLVSSISVWVRSLTNVL